MDWVPNHTAWDNPLMDTHPEFYAKDKTGQIAQAYDWTDVAQLDYGTPGHWNQPLWNQMRDDMAFWVREFGVDGFRCDAVGSQFGVPFAFWTWLRPQLNAIRPVFLLAEADDARPASRLRHDLLVEPAAGPLGRLRGPQTGHGH